MKIYWIQTRTSSHFNVKRLLWYIKPENDKEAKSFSKTRQYFFFTTHDA